MTARIKSLKRTAKTTPKHKAASAAVELGQVYVDLLTVESMTKILNWSICERSQDGGDPVNDWADFSNQLEAIQSMLRKSYSTLDRHGFNTIAAQGDAL